MNIKKHPNQIQIQLLMDRFFFDCMYHRFLLKSAFLINFFGQSTLSYFSSFRLAIQISL